MLVYIAHRFKTGNFLGQLCTEGQYFYSCMHTRLLFFLPAPSLNKARCQQKKANQANTKINMTGMNKRMWMSCWMENHLFQLVLPSSYVIQLVFVFPLQTLERHHNAVGDRICSKQSHRVGSKTQIKELSENVQKFYVNLLGSFHTFYI